MLEMMLRILGSEIPSEGGSVEEEEEEEDP